MNDIKAEEYVQATYKELFHLVDTGQITQEECDRRVDTMWNEVNNPKDLLREASRELTDDLNSYKNGLISESDFREKVDLFYLSYEPFDDGWARENTYLLAGLEPLLRRWMRQDQNPRYTAGATAYANAALRRQLDNVYQAKRGNRNNMLFSATCQIAKLSPHEIDTHIVEEEFTEAGLAIGLSPEEVKITINGAIKTGHDNPRYP